METVELKRNYWGVWNDAREKKTFAALDDIFEELMIELGYPKPGSDEAAKRHGAEAARLRNLQTPVRLK
jgi:hypothetical protein